MRISPDEYVIMVSEMLFHRLTKNNSYINWALTIGQAFDIALFNLHYIWLVYYSCFPEEESEVFRA